MVHIGNVSLKNLTRIGVSIVILELFFISLICGQGSEISKGGRITLLNLSSIPQTVYWQGYFGEVIIGGIVSPNIASASGGNLTELNLYFTSNCSVGSIKGEIYATTASSVQWSSIVAGTTTQVDSYLGLAATNPESGTNTLTLNLDFNVSGNLINSPATYTFVNSSPSNVFDTGVLNDTTNLVYVTNIHADQFGFESDTHDFQMIVPVPLGFTPIYYFSAELDITCALIDFALDPADILFSENSPYSGQDVIITATIHNLENGSYNGFAVEFLVDNLTQSTNQISINGNSTNTTQFTWTAVLGTNDITIRVDPSNNVLETNESNNDASKKITVSSPPPPPRKDYMRIYTNGNCVGWVISITVEDEENKPVSGADIDIFFNGSKVESLSTNPQGETSFTPIWEGVHTIHASKSGYYDEEKDLNVAACENCFDGIQNEDETDIDCGGSCPPCADGENCSIDSDCLSRWCLLGVCNTPSCFDGIQNQDETGIDCGGPCPPCAGGESCIVDSDCLSRWCYNGTCMIPTCFDGIQNHEETGIDCGGPCPPCHCFDGIHDGDETEVDCGGSCPLCQCSDGIKNYDETGIDCGGPCPPCAGGESCIVDSDCLSRWCYNGTCRTPACDDGIQGPGEEGIDCGGPCLPCHCFDSEMNYSETGTDCGGVCPPCKVIKRITNETETGETIILVYNASSICLNNRRDRGETDIDCGGHCPPCTSGMRCLDNKDCLSGFCYERICRISNCSDGVKGPREGNIDCGGPCGDCPRLKVDSRGYLGEDFTITIINPRDGLVLRVIDPNRKTREYLINWTGLSPYKTIRYKPGIEGLHLVELVGYDDSYVNIRKKPLIPFLEEIPEEVRSLFIPLTLTILSLIWWMRRRTKVVVDGIAIKRFISEDMLYWGLIKRYKRVYTAIEIEKEPLKIKELVFIDLSESELDQAEDLADRYSIPLDGAKTLILCRKLRAKKWITGIELPEDIGSKFEGTKIISIEDELNLMRL